MNTLVAVGAVNALFLAFLVGAKKYRVLPDRILSLFLLLISLAFGLVFVALEYDLPGLLLFLVYGNLLYAPLFYLYIATMVDPAYHLPRRYPAYFIPFVVSVMYLLSVLDQSSKAEITGLFRGQPFSERPVFFDLFYLLDLLMPPVYLVLSWLRLNRHRRRIADRFSFRESVDYHWLRRLVVVMAVVWTMVDFLPLSHFLVSPLTESQGLTIGFSLAALLVFYLGYHGFRQTIVYTAVPGIVPEAGPSYKKSGMTEDETRSYKARLLAYMSAERPYLESGLTIGDLAGAVGLSQHNLSEVINVGLGKSFYDFINGFRVMEFRRRVVQDQASHLTFLALALECGFNSKSSFNRIFKQHSGTTPSAFLKSHRDSACR